MRNLEEAGLEGLLAEPDPLRPDCVLALSCWEFCGGWAPERLPIYGALHDVPDWDLMLQLLAQLRNLLRGRA